jgi:hypothetical protein
MKEGHEITSALTRLRAAELEVERLQAALKKMLQAYAPWALNLDYEHEPNAVTGEQHIAAIEARDALGQKE